MTTVDPYRLLYYPDFAPNATWLRSMLLLSDAVVRIVPFDVQPSDSEELLRLQEAVPGCLLSVAPDPTDVAIEAGDEARLSRAFQALGKMAQRNDRTVLVRVSGGHFSIADHVFIHDSKLCAVVEDQLRANGLVLAGLEGLAPEHFLPVRQDASELILAGLASRIAGRLGVDAVTDQRMPFAFGALLGVPQRRPDDGAAEGALLSAVARLMIPAAIDRIPALRFRQLRDSYAGVRAQFRALTAELAAQHRLNRIGDADIFAARVYDVASEFEREYRQYRSSRYARSFKEWAPMCVGGALSVAAAFVSPLAAAAITTTTFAIQVVERHLSNCYDTERTRVFHMLAGLRRDVVRTSGIRSLV